MTVVVDIQKLELKIVEDLFQLLQQSIPIRVAMIIHGDSRVSQILYTVSARYGTAPFLELLRRYLKEGRPDIDVLFDDVAKEMNLKIGLPLEDLITLTKAKDRAAESILFTKRFDIESSPTIFVNGRYIPYDPSTWIREVINTYQEEIYNVQMSIVAQELDDDSEYFELIMDEERTYPSRHRAVFSIEESFMDTVPMDTFPMDAVSMDTIPMDTAPMDTFPMDAVSMDTVPMDTFPMDAVSMDTIPMGKGEWSYSDRATDNCAFSVALYLDVDRKVDISMAKVWLTAVNKTERKMRLIILPLSGKNENIKVFWKLAHGHITASEALKELQDPTKEVIDEKVLESWITANSEKARSATKLLKDGPVVAINGHLYGPFNDANVKVASWLQYEWQRRTERLQLLRMKSGLERNPTSLTLMTLFEGRLKELLDRYPSLFNGKAGMQIPTEKVNHFVHRSSDAALLHLTTMVNPFSTSAAKIAAILLELQELIEVTTIINALPAYTDSPLKGLCRFRRFDGSLQPLSKDTKFAMTLNVPAAWDVDGASDETDMDNMKIGDQVKVTLRKLLLEGEIKPHKGGRGLPNIPVELVDDHENVVDRSVAISFDGYAQLRALPGIYELRIPPNSGDIHMERKPIFLDSIAINKIEFNVKIGSEFLAERIRVPQLFADKIDKEINIFTIASGASYERLARIMILSVIKNTNSPVKFWLISTYTTSRFRQNLETMSKKYNFSYEFLSFKWPVWLTPQWRKHRRVWAQKILFLDSFPATIRRLIYIDADQVVRGDVAELAKIDLDGHVYGFVPFCESRAESAAIRFWRTGYWAEHLGGRPYHISALFVVDMVAFRAQAVGDRLRTHYQALVMDPNSLANLDQDLPNNMQRDVPIFSLPKEWLWCETWCAEEEKGRAKSIDLCSNPLKKEDKLTQGRRIITEWNIYDTEILKILGTDDVLNEAPTHNNDGVDIDVDIVQIQDQDHDHDEL
jgi:UDP-glucose:glycoprotein glucosyltransferase